jgi:hypothetical protein
MHLLPYPGGKRFAFTIVDDTDGATLENVQPVYHCLRDLGFRTTKTVWIWPPRNETAASHARGDTLQRGAYREFVESLKERGFEIALHNVTGESNRRDQILEGLDAFRLLFGHDPRMNIQHEKNEENLYFEFAQDDTRLRAEFSTRAGRWIQRSMRRLRHHPLETTKPHRCSGEDPDSPYFWGDLCRSRIQYVRTNVFLRDLDTVHSSPRMPFHHAGSPWVNYWFDCSNGGDLERFTELLREEKVHRLLYAQGCALVYTHFGKGFCEEGPRGFQLHALVRRQLEWVAGRADGWFATASEILDRLLAFQKIRLCEFPGGLLVVNENQDPVQSVTICDASRCGYWLPDGGRVEADAEGRLALPILSARSRLVLLSQDVNRRARAWNERPRPGWRGDLEMLASKALDRMQTHWIHEQ